MVPQSKWSLFFVFSQLWTWWLLVRPVAANFLPHPHHTTHYSPPSWKHSATKCPADLTRILERWWQQWNPKIRSQLVKPINTSRFLPSLLFFFNFKSESHVCCWRSAQDYMSCILSTGFVDECLGWYFVQHLWSVSLLHVKPFNSIIAQLLPQ